MVPCARGLASMNEAWPISDILTAGEKRKHDENDAGTDAESTAAAEFKKPRVRKKMHALLMAYCGQGYLGLQR